MEKVFIVKIGGNIIDDELALGQFLSDFSQISHKKILVHGGGKIATKIAEKLQIPTQMVDGRRVTDLPMLEVVTMVYGGLVNKQLVAKLQALGTNAIGLTGADGNAILSDKRPVKEIDYGMVGDVKTVNGKFFSGLLSAGVTPIIAPLTHDGKGNMLNTNADTMATEVAVALSQEFDTSLLYCFELKGVLRDFEDKNSVIPAINPSSYAILKSEGVISKGMIPKLENSLQAVDRGVGEVVICHAMDIKGIIQGDTLGTRIRK
ncbi:MAG: acetylglutamate kinase [Cytophagales bacterium]|nr:acetylglutamate kinase [Cytophagales bacterium]